MPSKSGYGYYTDQLGREIFLPHIPERIVSVVPSQTELLYFLGLKENIAGQTIFCIHPQSEFKKAVKVGGTKKLQTDKIRELQPHLIVANKEENDRDQIELLAQEFPVWISNIANLNDALDMIESLGQITGRVDAAQVLNREIAGRFETLQPQQTQRTLYLIWREPWMAAGSETFINSMLQHCRLMNVLEGNDRYPVLSNTDIQNLNPELVLLSSEPYPFAEKHMAELELLLPKAKVMLVDGEMFSWYGSRLLQVPDYFCSLFSSIQP